MEDIPTARLRGTWQSNDQNHRVNVPTLLQEPLGNQAPTAQTLKTHSMKRPPNIDTTPDSLLPLLHTGDYTAWTKTMPLMVIQMTRCIQEWHNHQPTTTLRCDTGHDDTAANPSAGFQSTIREVQRNRALTLKPHPAIPEQTNRKGEATILPQSPQGRSP